MNVVSQENEGYTAPSDEDTSPNSNSANALYVGCPCGLSRDELRHFHWIDADQKCMAKLSDGSACGHYYTEHYSLWVPHPTRSEKVEEDEDESDTDENDIAGLDQGLKGYFHSHPWISISFIIIFVVSVFPETFFYPDLEPGWSYGLLNDGSRRVFDFIWWGFGYVVPAQWCAYWIEKFGHHTIRSFWLEYFPKKPTADAT